MQRDKLNDKSSDFLFQNPLSELSSKANDISDQMRLTSPWRNLSVDHRVIERRAGGPRYPSAGGSAERPCVGRIAGAGRRELGSLSAAVAAPMELSRKIMSLI